MGRLTRAPSFPQTSPRLWGPPPPPPAFQDGPGRGVGRRSHAVGRDRGGGLRGPTGDTPVSFCPNFSQVAQPQKESAFLEAPEGKLRSPRGHGGVTGLRHKGPHPPRAALPSALSSTPAGSPHPPPSPPLMELPISRFPGPRGSQTGAPSAEGPGGRGRGRREGAAAEAEVWEAGEAARVGAAQTHLPVILVAGVEGTAHPPQAQAEVRDPVQPHHPPGRQVLHACGRHGSAGSPRSALARPPLQPPPPGPGRAPGRPAQIPAPAPAAPPRSRPDPGPALCASAFLQGVPPKKPFVIWDLPGPRRKRWKK